LALSGGRKAGLREREHRRRRPVVFNIGGSKYRLVVAVNYRYRMCSVRFTGTHKAYDRIDVATV
jgi:mRNA-degrading endonuclease HigB of HigAB toxin-antitoxin module